jgi:crossover junction endodeoxyribonuclease RuvC
LIIMGIDPGLASTGIGIIEEQPPRTWKALYHGAVTSTTAQMLPKRLERIHDLVARGIEQYRPDVVALESIFFARNVRSAVLMAHGRGAAILAACRLGIEIIEYSPLEIKQSVVGKGRASKHQVRQMVMSLLNMETPPRSDHEADALACALCHALRSGSVDAIRRKLAAALPSDEDPAYARRKEILSLSLRRGGRRRR